jgi:thiamine pyrophosphokinase
MNRKAIVVCGSNILIKPRVMRFFENNPFVVAADGGAGMLRIIGVKPDVLVGDFDSISETDLEYYRQTGVNIIRYKKEKDMTDSEIALYIALENAQKNKMSEIVILSRAGGRLDHQINNISLLETISSRGMRGIAADGVTEAMLALPQSPVFFDKSIFAPYEPYVSLIPVTKKVVTGECSGLLYDPTGIEFKRGASRGISNRFADKTLCIQVIKGKMLVMATISENESEEENTIAL